MVLQSDISNRSALEFNRKINKEMKKIYQPLKKFGISNFTFGRFFNGGKRLYVSADLDWIECYIANNYQNVIEHIEHYIPPDGIRYSFWTSCKRSKVFVAAEAFNVQNGFTIYEKNENYVDYYDFATDKNDEGIQNFYINNLAILESFVSDFRKKINHLLEPNDKTKLIVPKIEIIFEKIQRESYIDPTKIKKFMEEIKYHPKLNS